MPPLRLLTIRLLAQRGVRACRRANNRAIMIGRRAVKLELKFTVTATTAELQRPCARRVRVSSLSAQFGCGMAKLKQTASWE